MKVRHLSCLALLSLVAAAPAPERAGPPVPPSPYDLCDGAISGARTPVIPAALLPAIGRVESGRLDPATGRVRPWPWTINVEGVGTFYDSKEQVIAAVKAFQAKGVRSIDVGCMQVNLRHHPTAFVDLDAAFDPPTNATYAVRYLTALYSQTKDWNLATAYYHSQTQEFGEDYQRRVFGRVMTPMGPPIVKPVIGPFLPPALQYGAFPPAAAIYGAIPPASTKFGAFGPASSSARPRR